VIAAIYAPPVAQDPTYHNFIDTRTLHGVSNFWNVASNIPFILFGLVGLISTSHPLPYGDLKKLQRAYTLFFTGSILIGCGSIYYHYNPSTEALLWDRLPMTIAFMAFFSIIISEYISLSAGRFLLIPLLAAGACSVIYWYQTEQLGAGDLRPYAVVQFLPILLIPIILILFKDSGKTSKFIWMLLIMYVLSKIAEYFDAYIFDLSGEISGHSVKHLLASLGILFLYLHFRKQINLPNE
jgi:hypothetical protein